MSDSVVENRAKFVVIRGGKIVGETVGRVVVATVGTSVGIRVSDSICRVA